MSHSFYFFEEIKLERMWHFSTPEVKSGMEQFYQIAITPDAVAQTVLFAISQPESVGITEMTILPTKQA